jgi:hypothetical protein
MTIPYPCLASVLIPMRPGSHPWAYLLAFALPAGVVLGLMATTRRRGADRRRVRDLMMARILETMLYDGSALSIGATLRDLWREMAPPLVSEIPKALAGLVLLGLPALWVSGWIELRPLRPGERTIVEAVMHAGSHIRQARLEVSTGLLVETPALAVGGPETVSWRIRVLDACPRDAWVELRTPEETVRMPVAVRKSSGDKVPQAADRDMMRLTIRTHGSGHVVDRIGIGYPAPGLKIGGRPVPWLMAYLSMAAASMWCTSRWRRRLGHG